MLYGRKDMDFSIHQVYNECYTLEIKKRENQKAIVVRLFPYTVVIDVAYSAPMQSSQLPLYPDPLISQLGLYLHSLPVEPGLDALLLGL